MVDITVTKHGGLTIVLMPGEVSITELEDLEREITSAIRETESFLALDFSRLETIDSLFMSMLIRLSRKTIMNNQELILYNTSEEISGLFKLTSMDSLFNLMDTEEFDTQILSIFQNSED